MADGSEKIVIEIDTAKLQSQADDAVTIFAGIGRGAEDAGRTIDASMKRTERSTASSMESVKAQLRETTQQLAVLTAQYRSLSDEDKNSEMGRNMAQAIEQLTAKAGELRDVMDDVNQSIRNSASDTSALNAVGQGLNVLTSTAGAATGAMTMLGIAEQDMQEIQAKLQASLAISNALTVVQNNLQKQSALMLGIAKIQKMASAVAEDIDTAAKGRNIVVTKLATVAQAAFNAVASANPYVLLAVAIASVIGAVVALTLANKKATETEKALNSELDKQKQYYEELGGSTAKMHAEYNKLQQAWKRLKTTSEKNQFIKENAKAFENLGLKVKSTADAENVLVKNTAKVIESFRIRAQAMAAENQTLKAYEEYYSKIFQKGSIANGQYYYNVKPTDRLTDKEALGAGVRTNYQRQGGTTNGGRLGKFQNLTEEEIQKVLAYRKKNADNVKQQIKNEAERELKETTALYEGVAKEAYEKLATMDFLTTGGNGSVGGKTTPQKTTIEKESIKAREDYKKAGKNLIEAYEQARIEALEDSQEKDLRQLELNHNNMLAEIERQRIELLDKKKQAVIEAGGDASGVQLSDAEEEMFAKRTSWATQAYNKSVEEIRKGDAIAMREYLKLYGNYEQQIQAITEEYQERIIKAKTEGEAKLLEEGMNEEIENVKSKFGKSVQAFGELFADMGDKSVKEIQRILDKYKMLIDFMQGKTTRENALGAGITEEELRRVANGSQSLEDLIEAYKRLKGELADKSPWLTFQKAMADALEDIANGSVAKGIGNITGAVRAFLPELKAFSSSMGNLFGDSMSDLDGIISGMDGLMQTGQGVAQMYSGDIIGGAMSAVQGLSTLKTAITDISDKKHEKAIARLEEYINNLQKSYVDLEDAVSKTYSKAKSANIEAEIRNKQAQITAINQQIEEERSKKNTDNSRIQEWQDTIADLRRDIENLREEAIDAIFGEDVQTAISNFATAMTNAWESNASSAKNAKQVVRNMMKQMVTESIKSTLEASDAMEKIREKLLEFYTDNYLSATEQEVIEGMANRLQEELNSQYGWADNLFKDTYSQSGGSTGGIAQASQDSVDELNGRFTAIQLDTNNIVEELILMQEQAKEQASYLMDIRANTEQSVNVGLQAVNHLSAIEKNTRELYSMNERLELIERNTRTL